MPQVLAIRGRDVTPTSAHGIVSLEAGIARGQAPVDICMGRQEGSASIRTDA